ncbi:hypothetical protein WN944_006522 [Citrus x changshan-huyou]|uniref:Uncharacterized protein n=1 Tax=Citrus x changshan-huyou TaxID=2935761 RepID=A0AAP0QTX3_9ROSI
MSSSLSELEIEAARQLMLLCRDDLNRIHHHENTVNKKMINNKLRERSIKRDGEAEAGDDYKPSEAVLSTMIDEDDDEEYGSCLNLMKTRKRRFRSVDSIYSLTKPLMVPNYKKNNKFYLDKLKPVPRFGKIFLELGKGSQLKPTILSWAVERVGGTRILSSAAVCWDLVSALSQEAASSQSTFEKQDPKSNLAVVHLLITFNTNVTTYYAWLTSVLKER